METLSISSVSLPLRLVGQILEAWLNENRLRVAHRVTRVDVVDAYDPAGLVHVDLELAAPSTAAAAAASAQDGRAGRSVGETALELGLTHLVEAARNGNGGAAKNGGGAGPVKVEVAPETNSATSKRRAAVTAEQRESVLAMLRIGGNRRAIADACGVAVSTVYDIRNAAIAAGQLDAA